MYRLNQNELNITFAFWMERSC